MLYRRLFPLDALRTATKISTVLIIAWILTFVFASIFGCTPIAARWNPDLQHAKCLDVRIFVLVMALVNVAIDILLLLLPMPFVWQLNVSVKQRLSLLGLLSTGGL